MTAMKRLATGAKPKTPRKPTRLDEWFLGNLANQYPAPSVALFAERTGLSTCRVWALRRGDGRPSMRAAAAIAVETGGLVPMDYWNKIKIRPAARKRRVA